MHAADILAAPGAHPLQGRRHRVRLLGHPDRAPAAPAAAPARRHLPHQRAAVPGRPQARLATGDGLELHQLRHSAAIHLGGQKVPLQLVMAKTRHKSPRAAMRYVKPGDAAVAEVTSLLGPPRRSTQPGRYFAAGRSFRSSGPILAALKAAAAPETSGSDMVIDAVGA